MPVDDSFKKPGSVPFKWEIRPGVPKHPPSSYDHHRPFSEQKQPQTDLNRSFPTTPQKLKPPPAAFSFQSPMERRSRSFHSSPGIQSARYRFETRERSGLVSSSGCFPSPFMRRKTDRSKCNRGPGYEPEYYSDLETTSSRWSMSSRKSLSSFRDSPLTSSFPLSSSFFS